MRHFEKIIVEGFKSIQHTELELGDINVVVGANGAGKSNLIGVFQFLSNILLQRLQNYVAGDPDRFLFHGRKVTKNISLDVFSYDGGYRLFLFQDKDSLLIKKESIFSGGKWDVLLDSAQKECALVDACTKFELYNDEYSNICSFEEYHFHDTSDSSPIKTLSPLHQNRHLRMNGENLPAFLYFLQERHPTEFNAIQEQIRLVAPFFDRFILEPSRLNPNKIKLEWRHRKSDAYFDAYSLSDGTLRFMCLATVLLQPNPPALILLDEPELGLHPFALRLLADMLEAASSKCQILLATQSTSLLNHFRADQIIIADSDDDGSHFHRLDETSLAQWLEDYSLGELWEKNVLGGRP